MWVTVYITTALILSLTIISHLWRTYSKPKPVNFKKIVLQETSDDEEKRNAIVVGGEGLLGKKLAQALIEDGSYIVHSLDLYIPSEGKRLNGVASYMQTDITNESNVYRALEGMESVFLTASLQPCVKISDDQMKRVNIGGAKNIVNACIAQDVKRLIYTSSTSVTMGKYADPENGLTHESTPYPAVPLNAYVESKGRAEKLVREADGRNELKTVSLRLAGLLGGKNNPVVEFFTKPLLLYGGDGMFKIDFVDIGSVVKAQILAEQKLYKDQTKCHHSNGMSNESIVVNNGHAHANTNGHAHTSKNGHALSMTNGHTHTSTNGHSSNISENGHTHSYKNGQIYPPSTACTGKVYMITMREKCTLKELMEYTSQIRSVPKPIGLPHFILFPIAGVIRWVYLLTGIVLAPLHKMHIEFQRPFYSIPDLANKELGWADEMGWKEVIQKAINEY